MAMPELFAQAMALSIRYLKGFGMERLICFGSLFQPFTANTEMSLSANALQQLEVHSSVTPCNYFSSFCLGSCDNFLDGKL